MASRPATFHALPVLVRDSYLLLEVPFEEGEEQQEALLAGHHAVALLQTLHGGLAGREGGGQGGQREGRGMREEGVGSRGVKRLIWVLKIQPSGIWVFLPDDAKSKTRIW